MTDDSDFHEHAQRLHRRASDLHRRAAEVQEEHAEHSRKAGHVEAADRAQRLANKERDLEASESRSADDEVRKRDEDHAHKA